MFRRFISVALLLNILFSDAGVSIYQHTCLRSGEQNVSLINENCSDDSCCDTNEDSDACCSVSKKSCCRSQFSYFKGAAVGFKNHEQFEAIPALAPVVVSDTPPFNTAGCRSTDVNHPPLLLSKLKASFTQVFRC